MTNPTPLPCPFDCGAKIIKFDGLNAVMVKHERAPGQRACPLNNAIADLVAWNRRLSGGPSDIVEAMRFGYYTALCDQEISESGKLHEGSKRGYRVEAENKFPQSAGGERERTGALSYKMFDGQEVTLDDALFYAAKAMHERAFSGREPFAEAVAKLLEVHRDTMQSSPDSVSGRTDATLEQLRHIAWDAARAGYLLGKNRDDADVQAEANWVADRYCRGRYDGLLPMYPDAARKAPKGDGSATPMTPTPCEACAKAGVTDGTNCQPTEASSLSRPEKQRDA